MAFDSAENMPHQDNRMITEKRISENRLWFEGQGFPLPQDDILAKGLLNLARLEASDMLSSSQINGRNLIPTLYATRFEGNVYNIPNGPTIKVFHTAGTDGTPFGDFLNYALDPRTAKDKMEEFQLAVAKGYKRVINGMHSILPTHRQLIMMNARNELLARTKAHLASVDPDIFPEPEIITYNGQFVGMVISRQDKPINGVLPPANISSELIRKRFNEVHERLKAAGLDLGSQLPLPSKILLGDDHRIKGFTNLILPGDY